MTACQAFVLLRGVYLNRTQSSNKPASSHQPHVLYSVLSRAKNPIPTLLQPRFWKTALPAAVTVFLLFPPLSINMVASPMDSLFLTNATYKAHQGDSWAQPTRASHTPPDRYFHTNPPWQWHSRRGFGTCIFNPPQVSEQYAWGDSSLSLRLHPTSRPSAPATQPTCNISSTGTSMEQQLIASDPPQPHRLQSKALVAMPEASEHLVSDSKALVSALDSFVSDSQALVSASDTLVSDSQTCAACISEVCKLTAGTVSQLSVLSGSLYTARALPPLAISSVNDWPNRLSQAASTSLAPYAPLTEQHAAAPGIKSLKASPSAVDTANGLMPKCMSPVFQIPDMMCTAAAAVLLASEVLPCIMQVMPAHSAMQATTGTGVADSIFCWANVTNITLIIDQRADPALHHHTLAAVCAAVSPALVSPTITCGLDMHAMILHELDIHSTIIHEGGHDDKLSGKRMSRQHTVLGFPQWQGKPLSPFQFATMCLLHLH